jgi:hypothetical protein
MANSQPQQNDPSSQPKAISGRRTSRRRMLGLAVFGGLGAAMYAKPGMRELGVPGTYAQTSEILED